MIYRLSPSTLRLFKDCERCFWLHLNKKVRRPSGPFPSLPSGMDKVIKEYFDAARGKGIMPAEVPAGLSLFHDTELLKTWRSNFKGLTYTTKEGDTLRGAVDDILVTKKGELVVLDFKTRGYPLKENTASFYEDQLIVYTYLLKKNGHKTVDHAYLLFYYPKKVTTNNVSFYREIIKVTIDTTSAEKTFREALNCLRKVIPEPSKECQYCSD